MSDRIHRDRTKTLSNQLRLFVADHARDLTVAQGNELDRIADAVARIEEDPDRLTFVFYTLLVHDGQHVEPPITFEQIGDWNAVRRGEAKIAIQQGAEVFTLPWGRFREAIDELRARTERRRREAEAAEL